MNNKKYAKKSVLLINLGSPASPQVRDVYQFLTLFLNDPRVIDLPWAARKILVNLIIVPFRVRKSSGYYNKVWTPEGSPLIFHSENLLAKMKENAGEEFDVFLAMRYGKPDLKTVLQDIARKNYRELLIVPLFPQYASSTSGSVIEKSMRILSKMTRIPKVSFIDYFFDNQEFINAWKERLKIFPKENFDHILFSFHGLPTRQTQKMHRGESCEKYDCREQITDENRFCYRAQCYAHSRLLASSLNLEWKDYTVCFQSRFAKRWLSPFTDELIIEKAKSGAKKMLVVPLSFVADCLETNVEIAQEYKELFQTYGGETLLMPESLNASDAWVQSLIQMSKKHLS